MKRYPSTVPLFPRIQQLCRRVEKEENITILFAVENGSRAWRMESANSDYDVRFVFARPLHEYFCLRQNPDVIERYFDKDCEPCSSHDAFIDMVGFDLLKYARLLVKSNPTAIEWLVTDIVYHGRQNLVFKQFARRQFHPTALVYHYQSLCKQNYMKYIKSGDLISYKKYLYAFRGLVNARYVQRNQKLPPIDFIKAMAVRGLIPDAIHAKLQEIIGLKKQGLEKEIVRHIPSFDTYIESFLNEQSAKEAPPEQHIAVIEKEVQCILLGKRKD